MNKIGDFGIAMAIFAIFSTYGSLDYAVVFPITPYIIENQYLFLGFHINTVTFISLLLFLGAIGKSAQLGLHT